MRLTGERFEALNDALNRMAMDMDDVMRVRNVSSENGKMRFGVNWSATGWQTPTTAQGFSKNLADMAEIADGLNWLNIDCKLAEETEIETADQYDALVDEIYWARQDDIDHMLYVVESIAID